MKNYLTPEGFERIEKDLHQLVKVDRPQTVNAVSVAAAMGDRSENAEYIYGKRRLREIDSRIRFLEKRLENFEIIDTRKSSIETVTFGLWFQIKSETGELRILRLVGPDEIDPEKGWITHSSPLGQRVLGKKVGDFFEVLRPTSGTLEYEVLAISRTPIE
jgi:transcription elongation factor GreB